MKKFYFALAALAMSATAFAADYYVIGSNVNGHSWTESDETAKMTPVEGQDGIYTVTLDVLGTGFKLNDGGWDNPEANWGSSGDADDLLTLGEAFELTVGKDSGNISFDGVAEVTNAVVTFDLNNLTVKVEGEAAGEIEWFITGDFNEWALTGEKAVKLENKDNVLSGTVTLVYLTEEGDNNTFKISNTGWGKQYGHGEFSVDEINADNLTTELAEVGSDDAMPIHLEGTYNVTFDLETLEITFEAKEGGSVADINVDANAPVVYYNLQGIRVDNPAAGNIYIAKRGNVATKVVK